MQKRSCCRHSTDWRKRRPETESRSAKPEREGSFRRRDFGKSAAGSANDRAVCTGGLSDTEAAAARLNPLGDLRGTGGLPLFSPEGRTYSPPRRGSGTCRWQAVRSPRGIAAAAAASRQCHSTYGRCCHRLCRRQIPCDKRRELGQKFSTLCCRLPAQTCHRQLCRRDGRAFCPPIFSLRKRNRKKKRGERAMAIYHLEAKVVSRGAGRSAVAASAYLSCSRLYNDYDGIQHDYTKK